MRKRRLASLLLAASLAASALAGCGSGGKTQTTAAAAGGQTEAAGTGTAGDTRAAGGTSAAGLGTPLADVRVRQALAYAIDQARPGDIIIIAGKGHEDYQEIKGVKYPMDDRVLIAEILKERAEQG